jgi:hypothetical protein
MHSCGPECDPIECLTDYEVTFWEARDGHFYCDCCYYPAHDPGSLPELTKGGSPGQKYCPGCFFAVRGSVRR